MKRQFPAFTCSGQITGFGGWHMGNQSQDEVFLAAQEAVGAHRDSQGKIFCFNCKNLPTLLSQNIFVRLKNYESKLSC